MNKNPPPIHPAVLRYAAGELSAAGAIDLLGGDATIHDLIAQMRDAGIEPPRPAREVELAQLAKARKLLGTVP